MFAAESNNIVSLPSVSATASGYWPLWTARVLWLFAVLLAVWRVTEAQVPPVVWALVILALLAQLGFFCTAVLRQLPPWHTWATAAAALSVAAVTWTTVPASEYPLLLLAPIVLVDVARSYGWNSLLLL